MTDEQLRVVLIEYMKNWANLQVSPSTQGSLGAIAARLGFLKVPPGLSHGHQEVHLPGPAWSQAIDVLWQMVNEGIVRPGNEENALLPFFTPTSYGRRVIQDANSPYDPDGYFSRLTKAIPEIDQIILTYLKEALATFRMGCQLSSAVCLGCASERALDVLLESYTASLDEPEQSAFAKKTEGKFIKIKLDEFMKKYEHFKAKLPPDLRGTIESYMNGLFLIIRNQRNEAGHPTGASIDRDSQYALLQAFSGQLLGMYQLIRHFKK